MERLRTPFYFVTTGTIGMLVRAIFKNPVKCGHHLNFFAFVLRFECP
jgi:hypothetical protein